jgi:hypothetical protein
MLFGLYGEMHAVTRYTQELAVALLGRGLSVSIVTPRTDPQPWQGLPTSVRGTPVPPGMPPGVLAVQLRNIQRLATREPPAGLRPADLVLFSGFADLAMPKARVGGKGTEPRTEFSFTGLEEALERAEDVVTYLERGVKTEKEGKETKDAW